MGKRKAKTTRRTRSFVQRHIKRHIKEGMEQKRAVASTYSKARKKLQGPKKKEELKILRSL